MYIPCNCKNEAGISVEMKQGFLLLPFQDELSRAVECCGDLAESCPALSLLAPHCKFCGPMGCCTELPSLSSCLRVRWWGDLTGLDTKDNGKDWKDEIELHVRQVRGCHNMIIAMAEILGIPRTPFHIVSWCIWYCVYSSWHIWNNLEIPSKLSNIIVASF